MPEEDTPSAEMYFGAKRSHESTCTCPARRENEAAESCCRMHGGFQTSKCILNFAPASRRAAPSLAIRLIFEIAEGQVPCHSHHLRNASNQAAEDANVS
jgi:hypothetical protein